MFNSTLTFPQLKHIFSKKYYFNNSAAQWSLKGLQEEPAAAEIGRLKMQVLK